MIEVEHWAELRREHFVRGTSIRSLAKRTGLSRNTVRRALRSEQPPPFSCPPRPSQLDPFREEIQRLLPEEPRLTALRVRELIAELGFGGGQPIVDEYVRELRPPYLPTAKDLPAHELPARRAVAVRPLVAGRGDSRRPRPDAQGLLDRWF